MRRGRRFHRVGAATLVTAGAVLASTAMASTAVGPLATESAASAVESMPLGPAGTESLPVGDPAMPESTSVLDMGDSLKTLLSLGFVLGLAVAGAAGLKALSKGRGGLLGALGPGGPSPSGVLEILGRYPVGSGQTMVLLRLDRRVLLVHQTLGRKNASMRTLAEVSDADEVASILLKTREAESERVDAGFREAMRKLESDFSQTEAANLGADLAAETDVDEAREALTGPSPRARTGAETGPGLPTPVGNGDGDVVTVRSNLRRWAAGGVS